jgi:enoyl-CoA hydratase/carnithine racemase
VESEGGVARIFLNRPEKVNAPHSALLASLLEAINRVGAAPDLRVVLLGGRGKAFCGGADVKELSILDASSAPRFIQKIQAVCEALRGLAVPVVARLQAPGSPCRKCAWGSPRWSKRRCCRASWACEWGLIEQVGGDDAVETLIDALMKSERNALRMQKQLLQLWEEAPLATSIEKSIELFARSKR